MRAETKSAKQGEDCGQAGILEAKIWNTTDKVTYIIKLLHLAKEHGIYLRAHPDYERPDAPLSTRRAQRAGAGW